jgi:hypothetical protein
MAPMNTRPIAAAEVASLAHLVGQATLLAGIMAVASRQTLTPPYRAARGPIPMVVVRRPDPRPPQRGQRYHRRGQHDGERDAPRPQGRRAYQARYRLAEHDQDK